MADQTVRIENLPESSSKQRVAFELMVRISNEEYHERGTKGPEKAREYYLDLYSQCRKRVY